MPETYPHVLPFVSNGVQCGFVLGAMRSCPAFPDVMRQSIRWKMVCGTERRVLEVGDAFISVGRVIMPSSCRLRRKWGDSARLGSGSAEACMCNCARVRVTLASSCFFFSSVRFSFSSFFLFIFYVEAAERGGRPWAEEAPSE